jgi:PAS domain S-box-containing protein
MSYAALSTALLVLATIVAGILAAALFRARRRVAHREERFRSIVETTGEGIWVIDGEGRTAYVNPRMTEMLGYAAEEMLGRSSFDFVFPEDLPRSEQGWQERRSAAGPRIAEWRLRRKDGSALWTLANTTFLPAGATAAGPAHVLGMFSDVTESRQVLQDLREADRRKDEFLAMLAHELRNPLAPILNAAQVLRVRAEGDPLLVRPTELIERQTRQMARLVDDLLDVSRVTRGRIDLRKSPVELAALVEEAVQACTSIIDRRGQELSIALPPHPVWLHADSGRLVQSLCNLLTNAAKYSERGGRIELHAREEAGEVVISVRDEGRGIPPEVLPHVFDLFVQADRALDRAEGGLGIGLTLVRSLVEMHGGSVAVASEGDGRGSEFTVRLPRLADRGEPRPGLPEAEAAALAAAPRPILRRVLVVDDNLDAAQSAAELVGLWGHEARVAHDGPAALVLASRFRPDVVLLDIGLPGMDGYEVARLIRAAAGGEALLLVAVTGYGQAEDRQRALAHGFDLHLTKPVDPQALRRLLEAPAAAPGQARDQTREQAREQAPQKASLPAGEVA